MADPTGVTVRLDGGVAVLCLDGAERMNAIGSHTYRALAAAVTDAGAQRADPGGRHPRRGPGVFRGRGHRGDGRIRLS